jgi:hypothetical protein
MGAWIAEKPEVKDLPSLTRAPPWLLVRRKSVPPVTWPAFRCPPRALLMAGHGIAARESSPSNSAAGSGSASARQHRIEERLAMRTPPADEAGCPGLCGQLPG